MNPITFGLLHRFTNGRSAENRYERAKQNNTCPDPAMLVRFYQDDPGLVGVKKEYLFLSNWETPDLDKFMKLNDEYSALLQDKSEEKQKLAQKKLDYILDKYRLRVNLNNYDYRYYAGIPKKTID